MRKSTGILLSLATLFFGIVLGFLISPIKGGLNIGNNRGNGVPTLNQTADEDDSSEDDLAF